MALAKDQLDGITDCVPANYPSSDNGFVIVRITLRSESRANFRPRWLQLCLSFDASKQRHRFSLRLIARLYRSLIERSELRTTNTTINFDQRHFGQLPHFSGTHFQLSG